jgi:adenylate kinase family enzyme
MLIRAKKRSETSGRLDDNDKIFMTRIRTFFDKTYPCIEIFVKSGVVKKVNTEKTIEEVYKEVRSCFEEFFP